MGEARRAKAGVKLVPAHRATNGVGGFEQNDLSAALGQQRGCRQAVMPATDNNGVVCGGGRIR